MTEPDVGVDVIERELRRALEHDQLRLHFQPVVNPATGAMAGAEALLRWQHPTRGLLTPDRFLGPAEHAGLLDPIGEWVIGEAIAQRATWPTGTFVSVNLAPSELASAADRDLVGHIERACAASGLAPSDVWVEVTEQPITALEPTLATLRALGDLGVTVALDDFGSGSASLARLRQLPFDVCKLDRSFVTAMEDRAGIEVVRTVVAMVRAFGLEVVVEGVETAEQHDQLDRLGVELLQGYHLARPAPAASVRERFEVEVAARQPASRDAGSALFACGPEAIDHRVLSYDDEQTLVTWVVDTMAPALAAGDPVAFVATPEHRAAFAAALAGCGIDVEAVVAAGQLVELDAAGTLVSVLEDGTVSTARLAELAADLLPDDGRTLWVYGEMVALLWQRGEVTTAMALEDAWNTCLEGAPLSLLCAYPSEDLAAIGPEDGFEQIAGRHSAAAGGSPTAHRSSEAVPRTLGAADLARDLRDLEARVAASERFGAMVVHELRNPATVLKLALDALRGAQGEGLPAGVGDLLDIAADSADTIERLAADLLLAGKLERQKFGLRRAPFDLSCAVAAVVERARLTSGREVRFARPADPVHAYGDEARERQVLTNLLDNAVDCSPQGSPVTVSFGLEPDHVEVRVADHGPGVDARDRRRLFEPFTQLGANRRSTGAGLGLHIVDQLVRAQGGAVWVEDNRGGGAVFCHTLPRVTAHVQDLLRPLTAPRSVA